MRPRLRSRSLKSLLADLANLFEDALFDLADPHPGQPVDLADLLQRMRTLLRSDDDAVVALGISDPVLASLPLAVHAMFGLDREARRAWDHSITLFVLDDPKSSFVVLHHCLST